FFSLSQPLLSWLLTFSLFFILDLLSLHWPFILPLFLLLSPSLPLSFPSLSFSLSLSVPFRLSLSLPHSLSLSLSLFPRSLFFSPFLSYTLPSFSFSFIFSTYSIFLRLSLAPLFFSLSLSLSLSLCLSLSLSLLTRGVCILCAGKCCVLA